MYQEEGVHDDPRDGAKRRGVVMGRGEMPKTLCGPVDTTEQVLDLAQQLHPGFVHTNWRWSTEGRRNVPTVERIVSSITNLVRDCDLGGSLATGGLEVHKDKNGAVTLYCDPKLKGGE